MTEDDFAELASGYALNALSAGDRSTFESARATHPEWEHHVAEATNAAAALAETVVEVTPPPALRSALLDRIAATPALDASSAAAHAPAPHVSDLRRTEAPSTTTPQHPSSLGARVRRRWFALAASVALVIAVGIGGAVLATNLNRPAVQVALEQIEQAPDAQSATVEMGDGGTATAHWSASLGKAVLEADGMPSIADDETFELWFVRGDEAIPAGTFEAAAEGPTRAALSGEFADGDAIAVTVEADGGSPTGSPTSAPLFVIAT